MKIEIVLAGKVMGADVQFHFAFELVAVSSTVSVYDAIWPSILLKIHVRYL